MITIIYSTHKDETYNNEFKSHLHTAGVPCQILEYRNNNEFSLANVYNRGIDESVHDIVVCLHNDIRLENGWGKKLLKQFELNPDYGIIGKAGSCYFPTSGVYWERMNETMVGQVYHHPPGGKKFLSRYSTKLPYLIPVVTIDGVFMAFDKTKIKHRFDETIGKFHYYDHCFCLQNFLDDVKIGVTCSFDLTHASVGQPNEEFHTTKEQFLKKYGQFLPLDVKPEKIFVEEIKDFGYKNFGKVAVIIPTKNNLKNLMSCIHSFLDFCDFDRYEFFIADTGSSEEEKQFIKDFKCEVKIHFVEYDYYNFSKINNDMVKNHIPDDFKFLLFCNDDVKLLNDVISGMLEVFRKNVRSGTVGARLHYEDNTVQHNGFVIVHKDGNLIPAHLGHGSYYRYTSINNKVTGNSGALMMIRRNLFERCGYFNESYQSCFEDVELSLRCLLSNHENFSDGSLVAYHYEGVTRNLDPLKNEKTNNDFINVLQPFIKDNFEKLKPYIIFQ